MRRGQWRWAVAAAIGVARGSSRWAWVVKHYEDERHLSFLPRPTLSVGRIPVAKPNSSLVPALQEEAPGPDARPVVVRHLRCSASCRVRCWLDLGF